ncbi:DsbC family protein [Halarcobacter bivalviorum]|uniref:Thiol:disulfide interchange protein n=1 Tax=Halarcobacter bivalviorum TaxID=663364 RepID=A0AAX2ACK4_9BACT|nr:DsbC family protein [Halarcobacter bivalviorum]AXH12097.1 thiol:disulfide interchange protein [Halarcobacter bivalviorum]RXK11206.1 thiol:disulfide interchange protein [Halarcobacter bivalviorum]
MIKTTRNILLALCLTTGLSAADKLSQKELKEIQALPLLNMAKVQVQDGTDFGSLYGLNVKVQGRMDTVFLTKDKKYLLPGDAISTQNGQPLELPIDISPTLGKEAFTFGKGKDEYVLFTDPECPYCKKFESYFSQIEDKVKIRVFFFPLSFHENAKDISLYIMSQNSYKDKVNAMINTTKDSEEFKNRKIDSTKLAKLEKSLEEQMTIATDLGISGTPTLFDKNGNRIVWAQMLQDFGIEVK